MVVYLQGEEWVCDPLSKFDLKMSLHSGKLNKLLASYLRSTSIPFRSYSVLNCFSLQKLNWLRKWREYFFVLITQRNEAKPNQSQTLSNTQLKPALIQCNPKLCPNFILNFVFENPPFYFQIPRPRVHGRYGRNRRPAR